MSKAIIPKPIPMVILGFFLASNKTKSFKGINNVTNNAPTTKLTIFNYLFTQLFKAKMKL